MIAFIVMSLHPPSLTIPAPGAVFASIALSFMTLQLGCASPDVIQSSPTPSVSAGLPIPALESVPEWALAATHSDDDRAIGIGSGETLDGATRLALQDVASGLSVFVESQLRDVYRETEGTSAESLEQIIETRVLGTRFSGWERSRSARSEGIFWVEVRIDRRRLVRDSMLELNDLATGVDMRLEGAVGSSLSRLIALQATAHDRERVSSLVALIDTLDSNFDRAIWNRRRGGWKRIDESARRSLIFEVRFDPASAEIANWLESRLASERFSTRQGSCQSPEAVCIDIHSEIVEANVANRHIAKIRSFFSVFEPGGSVVRKVDLTGRGNSKTDRKRARRQALDDLYVNFHEAGVLTGLIRP